MFKRILSLTVILCFFLTTLGPLPKAHADSDLDLPVPGTMINLSPAYQPVIIKGLTVHKDNPFLFDFIVDVGQDKMSGAPLKKEGEKLIKYFLASLAIPDKDVWVNLSPYEKNRMIPAALGQTDMGRDLLEQDYILKQITASLIYPEKDLGRKFWQKIYAKSQAMYGTTQIPVNTFNKVWIMADRAEVFEHNQTAFVVDSHLKVMLEEDYLALQKHNVDLGVITRSEATKVLMPDTRSSSQSFDTHSINSQIVRSIILPELEKEINTGKNFANLRQIFNSIILASWYKKNLKQTLLNQVYSDKSKVKGVMASGAKQSREEIYEQYLKAYKKGVFNYIKEDINASSGQTVPRKYFSGGLSIVGTPAASPAMTHDPATLFDLAEEKLEDFATLASSQPKPANPDKAMGSDEVMTTPNVIDDKVKLAARVVGLFAGLHPAYKSIFAVYGEKDGFLDGKYKSVRIARNEDGTIRIALEFKFLEENSQPNAAVAGYQNRKEAKDDYDRAKEAVQELKELLESFFVHEGYTLQDKDGGERSNDGLNAVNSKGVSLVPDFNLLVDREKAYKTGTHFQREIVIAPPTSDAAMLMLPGGAEESKALEMLGPIKSLSHVRSEAGTYDLKISGFNGEIVFEEYASGVPTTETWRIPIQQLNTTSLSSLIDSIKFNSGRLWGSLNSRFIKTSPEFKQSIDEDRTKKSGFTWTRMVIPRIQMTDYQVAENLANEKFPADRLVALLNESSIRNLCSVYRAPLLPSSKRLMFRAGLPKANEIKIVEDKEGVVVNLGSGEFTLKEIDEKLSENYDSFFILHGIYSFMDSLKWMILAVNLKMGESLKDNPEGYWQGLIKKYKKTKVTQELVSRTIRSYLREFKISNRYRVESTQLGERLSVIVSIAVVEGEPRADKQGLIKLIPGLKHAFERDLGNALIDEEQSHPVENNLLTLRVVPGDPAMTASLVRETTDKDKLELLIDLFLKKNKEKKYQDNVFAVYPNNDFQQSGNKYKFVRVIIDEKGESKIIIEVPNESLYDSAKELAPKLEEYIISKGFHPDRYQIKIDYAGQRSNNDLSEVDDFKERVQRGLATNEGTHFQLEMVIAPIATQALLVVPAHHPLAKRKVVSQQEVTHQKTSVLAGNEIPPFLRENVLPGTAVHVIDLPWRELTLYYFINKKGVLFERATGRGAGTGPFLLGLKALTEMVENDFPYGASLIEVGVDAIYSPVLTIYFRVGDNSRQKIYEDQGGPPKVIASYGSNDLDPNLRLRGENAAMTVSRAPQSDKAALAPGGIDFNTSSNGMHWKVSKDGHGVEMNIDPALIAKIRREGIDSLSEIVLRMTPITSIWPLVGLPAPMKS